MQPIATDEQRDLLVCLSLTTASPAKMAEPISRCRL